MDGTADHLPHDDDYGDDDYDGDSSWLETSTWWQAGTKETTALKLIVIYFSEIQNQGRC